MILIFEHSGVLLHVDYTLGDPTLFNCVRALGPDYQPVGPDLLPLIKNLAFVNHDAHDTGEVTEAEMFLSTVVGEIDGQSHQSQLQPSPVHPGSGC